MRIFTIAILFAAACGSDDPGNPPADSAPIDAPAAGCVENPQTHDEIINGCTTAASVERRPTLPLLNDDGTLPPLPP